MEKMSGAGRTRSSRQITSAYMSTRRAPTLCHFFQRKKQTGDTGVRAWWVALRRTQLLRGLLDIIITQRLWLVRSTLVVSTKQVIRNLGSS